MEKILSDEERLRRAIEISQRRNSNYRISVNTESLIVSNKKDYKLFKKMVIQIIICLLIYIIFYLIVSTNYTFSVDVIKSTNEILNYDMNFGQIYNNFLLFINSQVNKDQDIEQDGVESSIIDEMNQIVQDNEEINTLSTDINQDPLQVENTMKEEKNEEIKEKVKTQEELDVELISKLCDVQKPLTGFVTSEFGEREATIEGMTTNHKGIDIAANQGTSIKAAIDGIVNVAEENNEYGKFIKIVNGDIMTVYAHCKTLKVKKGDKVKKGQIIATVGTTGNSTGPHLHFEIRFKNRYVNPRLLIDF